MVGHKPKSQYPIPEYPNSGIVRTLLYRHTVLVRVSRVSMARIRVSVRVKVRF